MDLKQSPTQTLSSTDSFARPVLATSIKTSSPVTQQVDAEKAPSSDITPPYSAFSHARQWSIILIVTAAGFFAPLTGAVYLPSLVLFESVFRTSSTVINASVSVYWAVFGIAPMFGATMSDYGGRKTIYVVYLAIFLIANTLLASIPPTVGGLFTLRVFQALGSSMVTSIGAGTVADVSEPAKRASRIGLFLLGPQLGPLLGPLIGGQFSHERTWRWVFGFLCEHFNIIIDPCILTSHSGGLLPGISPHTVLPTRNTTMPGRQWNRVRQTELARQATPTPKAIGARRAVSKATEADHFQPVEGALFRSQLHRELCISLQLRWAVVDVHRLSKSVAKSVWLERS